MDACTDLLECTICMQPFEDARILKCGHTFCSGCLGKIQTSSTSPIKCPTCRQLTHLDSISELVKNFYVNDAKDALTQTRQEIDAMQNDFSRKENEFETSLRRAKDNYSRKEHELDTVTHKVKMDVVNIQLYCQEEIDKKCEEFSFELKRMEKITEELNTENITLKSTLYDKNQIIESYKKCFEVALEKNHDLEIVARKAQDDFSRKEQEFETALRKAQKDFYNKEQEHKQVKTTLNISQDHFSKREHELKTALKKSQEDFSKLEQEKNDQLNLIHIELNPFCLIPFMNL